MRGKLAVVLFFVVSICCAQNAEPVVILKSSTARLVAKDLIKGDYCAKELECYKILSGQLETKVQIQDKLIENKDTQILVYSEIVMEKNKELSTQNKKIKSLGFWNKVLLVTSGILLSVVLIK